MYHLLFLADQNRTNNRIKRGKSFLIKEYDVKNPNFVDKEAPFNIYNFVKCLEGIGCIDDEFVKRNIVDNISDEFVDTRIVELLVITKKSKNHNDFLNELTNI